MLITNETLTTNFRSTFDANLEVSNSILIASGYLGVSEIVKYREKFCEISRTGGTVKLIHGMGGVEGIRKNLYKHLCDLDNDLKKTNIKNRVFVHKTHYHGKMYITDHQDKAKVLIGSSNFSSSGFQRNLELNYCHSDKETCDEAKLLFERLRNNSVPIDKIRLPDQMEYSKQSNKHPLFDLAKFNGAPDTSIEIHVTEKSNLNLFLSAGRLNKSNGIYAPRPFYEVELTIGSENLAKIRQYIPNQTQPAEFAAVTDLGTTFTVKFKRKTSKRGDTKTLHQTGIDFMSSPRSELGHYIKGKLMQKGLLSFGEQLTEDALVEYGNKNLHMYFRDDGILYLKF